MPLVSDSKALAVLKEEVLPLIAGNAAKTIRAWVPCCASGEDAYALAMLFSAYVEEHRLGNDVRVIASDEDSDALGKARAGVYPQSVRQEFLAAGLERYFREENQGFRVIKRIRDCVLLSAHGLLADPPFPHLDLVFCGMFFGELGNEEQVELLRVLHYSLVSGGFLLLGARRAPTGLDALFSSVDRERGIYRRREEDVPSLAARPVFGGRRSPSSSRPSRQAKRSSDRPGLGGALERLLLDAYVPACLVVNDDNQIVYSLGKVSRFFQPPQGLPTNDLLLMAKPQLREPLRGLLQSRSQDGDALRLVAEDLDDDGSSLDVTIELRALPGPNGAARRVLVFSTQVAQQEQRGSLSARATKAPASLLTTEAGTEREELTSLNQELQSLNEEFESANEELQISQEELQSINEELETVNNELRSNVAELDRVNTDLRNLMENTQIATLFLDNDLRIRIFTPAAQNLFRFIAADRGRPITDIAPRFGYGGDLRSELLHVQRTRAVRETQVQAALRWYLMRIMPYLNDEAGVEGLVLTFSDITELKLADLEVQRLSRALEHQVAWLKTLVDVVPVGIGFHEIGSDTVRLNRSAVPWVDAHETRDIGDSGLAFAWRSSGASTPSESELWRAMTSPGVVAGLEVELDRQSQQQRQVLVHAAPLYDAQGVPYAKVSGLLDVSEIKRERERALAREQQQAIVADLGLHALAAQNLELFLCESLQIIGMGAGAELCDLTRLSPDGQGPDLIASWRPDALERDWEPGGPEPLGADALDAWEPSVLSSQQPFPDCWPERLRRAGVTAGARLVIRAHEPFGVLGVYRRGARDFSKEDLDFLRAIANVLTSAIQRQLIERVRLKENQEAALRESERQMRRGERLASLGTFATGIAHELNNPLSNIVLNADYAAKTPDSARRVKLLEAIRENALRSGRIVDSVLRFARDEVTEKWLNDLNAIARHATAHVITYLGAEKLRVTFELVEPSLQLNCNPTEIEQVFVNLLKNAAQAHPAACRVRVCSEVSGHDAKVTISDDGPGVPEADLERIFDPFYSTQRAAGGTGLGLSISHRILTTHGGSIRVTNTKGSGASFEFRLPLAQQQSSATEDHPSEGS